MSDIRPALRRPVLRLRISPRQTSKASFGRPPYFPGPFLHRAFPTPPSSQTLSVSHDGHGKAPDAPPCFQAFPSADLVFAPTLAHWGQSLHLAPSHPPRRCAAYIHRAMRLTPRMRRARLRSPAGLRGSFRPHLPWTEGVAAPQLQTRKKPLESTISALIPAQTSCNTRMTRPRRATHRQNRAASSPSCSRRRSPECVCRRILQDWQRSARRRCANALCAIVCAGHVIVDERMPR